MVKKIQRVVTQIREAQWRKTPVRAPEGFYWDLIGSKLIDVYGELVLVEVGREIDGFGFYVKNAKSTDTLTYPQWSESVKDPNDIRAASRRLLHSRERVKMDTEVFEEIRRRVRGTGR